MLPFVRVKTNSQEGRELNRSTQRVFQSLTGNPLLNGPNIVNDVVLTTADTLVSHGLGRTPLGYIIIGLNANATIYTSPTTNNASTATLILRASGNVTANILFF